MTAAAEHKIGDQLWSLLIFSHKCHIKYGWQLFINETCDIDRRFSTNVIQKSRSLESVRCVYNDSGLFNSFIMEEIGTFGRYRVKGGINSSPVNVLT